jgi:hypothetical protein
MNSDSLEKVMTREEAERLSIVFLQIAGRLNETAAFVRDKDDEARWHEYRRAVGKAMAEVFELGEQLWRRFPELRPEQLKGSYRVDPSIYEPSFYDWGNGGETDKA